MRKLALIILLASIALSLLAFFIDSDSDLSKPTDSVSTDKVPDDGQVATGGGGTGSNIWKPNPNDKIPELGPGQPGPPQSELGPGPGQLGSPQIPPGIPEDFASQAERI